MAVNILAFGPNGSGKGTQGAIVKDKYGMDHIESGAIFREHIKGGTELGMKAKAFIEAGDLVPDEITIPMVLETLAKSKEQGWLLDGFPRSLAQAEALDSALKEAGMKIDYVMEILLDRQIAKERIMGRRLCANDNNHPNHIAFDAIKPVEKMVSWFVAYVAESSVPVPMIRMKMLLINAMISTMILRQVPWQQ